MTAGVPGGTCGSSGAAAPGAPAGTEVLNQAAAFNSTVSLVDNELGPRHTMVQARERLSPARRTVLDMLMQLGGTRTVKELAAALEQHPNTVREHLDVLVDAELVVRSLRRSTGRGRPAALYRATLAAAPAGPEYAVLAEALISYLAVTWTPAERTDHALAAGRAWGRALRNHQMIGPTADGATVAGTDDAPPVVVSPEPAEGAPVDAAREGGLDAAMAGLTQVLDDAGFACRTSVAPDGTRATQLRRCPVLDLARRHPDIVCASHLGMVQEILGDTGIEPERIRLVPFARPGACMLYVQPPR